MNSSVSIMAAFCADGAQLFNWHTPAAITDTCQKSVQLPHSLSLSWFTRLRWIFLRCSRHRRTRFSRLIFTARLHVMQRTVLLSKFCPSVRPSDACIMTKLNNALRIFDTTRNGNHSSFLTPTVVGGRCPLPSEICVQSDPPSSKNADFDRFPLITSQL